MPKDPNEDDVPELQLKRHKKTMLGDALTLENRTLDKNGRYADISDDTREMVDYKTQARNVIKGNLAMQKADERMEIATRSLNNCAKTLPGLTGKVSGRLDDYKKDSDRNYILVKKLDKYLAELNKTGATGSETYTRARDAIAGYSASVRKIDGKIPDENMIRELNGNFNALKEAVSEAIASYVRRGIKSKHRNGGIRRALFEKLSRELYSGEERGQRADGGMSKAHAQTLSFAENRIRELENDLNSETIERNISIYKDNIDRLKQISTEVKTNEPNQKVALKKKYQIDDKISAMNSVYGEYQSSVNALRQPMVTRLEKEEMAARIKKWKDVRKNCDNYYTNVIWDDNGRNYTTKDEENGFDQLNLAWDRASEYLLVGENTAKPEYALVTEMLVRLDKMKKKRNDFLRLLRDEPQLEVKKGTAAEFEEDYRNACDAVNAVSKLGSDKIGKRFLNQVKKLKTQMSKGGIACTVGELIISLTELEKCIYQSREDINSPLSDVQLKAFNAKLSGADLKSLKWKKDSETLAAYNKRLEKKGAGRIIQVFSRMYDRTVGHDAIDRVYHLRERQEYVTRNEPWLKGEEWDRMPEVKKTITNDAKRLSDRFSKEYTALQDDSDYIYESVSNSGLLTYVEISTQTRMLQRRMQTQLLNVLRERFESARIDPEKKDKDTVRAKNSILYYVLANTEIGKACSALDHVQGASFGGYKIHMSRMANTIGSNKRNYTDEKLELELEKYGYNAGLSLDWLAEESDKDTRDAECRRVEALVNNWAADNKASEREIAAFKGEQAG